MNYRQWKKRYKKQHGYNPPVSEDKRKQAKLVAQQFTATPPKITETINNIAPAFYRALASACETISNSFASAGRTFGDMAENYNTATVQQYRESEGTA